MSHTTDYLAEVVEIAKAMPHEAVEDLARRLCILREKKGKLYIIGLGGSLANAIHMAADLRKLCDIDAEAFDNMAELTARANDEGLETIFVDWLKRASFSDALLVLSVGGGTSTVSKAIVNAVNTFNGKVYGIVGPHGGFTALRGEPVVKIPADGKRITPHTEAFQAITWHCLVSHPLLQRNATKW